jgi:hypothetical protein
MARLFTHHGIGWLFALLLTAGRPGAAGAQTVVTGTVVDSSRGTPVPRATIRAAGTYTGTAADEEGRFSISVPPEVERIRIGAVGYAAAVRSVPAGRDSVGMTVQLRSRSVPLGHVTVEADPTTGATAPSSYTIRPASVTQAPALGEPDVIRAAARLPGVAQPNDLDARLNVRGGSSDQNQYLLDGIEVYNPTHLFGLLGAFNTYAVGSTTVQAASFPARHGGRLSSVINVRTRVPPDSGYTRANLSLTSLSGAHAQKWGDTGVVVGARRTYLDPILAAIGTSVRYNFGDANVKVTHDLTDKISVAGMGFLQRDALASTGDDQAGGTKEATVRWGNALGALRLRANHTAWTQVLTGSVVRTATAVEEAIAVSEAPETLDNRLRDWTVQYEGVGAWQKTRVEVGGRWKRRTFDYRWEDARGELTEGLYGPGGGEPLSIATLERRTVVEGHVSVTRRLFDERFTLRGGLRYGGPVAGEAVLQPRVRATMRATSKVRLHASAGRYAQHVATGVEGIEFNVTEPLFPLDRPQTAWTYTTGVKATFGTAYRVRATAYARTMNAFPRLKRNGQFQSETQEVPPFRRGTATAYGLDVLAERIRGRVTGQLAYAFGHVRTKFGEARFPPSWSIPHSLRTTIGVDLGQWYVQTTGHVHSGLPYTPYVGAIRVFREIPDGRLNQERYLPGERNSERLPYYARVDVGVRRTFHTGWGNWELYVQVLNLLNRRNILRIDPNLLYENKPYGASGSEIGVDRSLPVLPTLGAEFTF